MGLPLKERDILKNFRNSFFIFIGYIIPFTGVYAQTKIELVRASEAEYISIQESDEGVMILKGGIILKMKNRIINAETIKINPQSGEIFGTGGVTLQDEEQTVTGERFYFDNHTGRGIVYNAKAAFKARYFWGDSFKRIDSETVIAKNVYFTSCVAKPEHYGFRVKKLWIYSDNQMLALHIFYEVGGVPVFYLPAIFQNELSTGIITQYGYNRSKGHFLQNTYYLGILSDKSNAWVPNKGKLMFDWYQRGGEFLGTRLWKESANLNYDLELSLARYRQIQGINDPGGLTFTNYVTQPDGSRKLQSEAWWKIKADVQATWNKSHEYDSRSSLSVKFEHYSHPNFDAEFGSRFEPKNFFEAISRFRFFQQSIIHPFLNWEAAYTEDWQDNHFSLQVIRQMAWYSAATGNSSSYKPVYAMMPNLRFSKRKMLFDPYGSWFSGGWAEIKLGGNISRQYSNGDEIRTVFSGDGLGSLIFFINPWRLISLQPVFGYGVNEQFARQSDATQKRENDRNSYQFLFTRQTLTLGNGQLFAKAIYHYEYAIQQAFIDPTFGAQRGHSIDLSLNTDIQPYINAHLQTKRDLRKLPYALPETWRWTPLVFSMNADYDFMHGFQSGIYGLENIKYRNFMGIGFSNSYAYLIQFERSGYNNANLYYQLGGYRLYLLRELTHFRVGVNWHQNFINERDSEIRLNWEVNILLHPFWRLIAGGASRAERMERYNPGHPQYTNFFQDIARSVNLFDPTDRSGRVFNLQNFYTHLEHNLHRWLLRVSYTIGSRTVFYGPQLRNRISFFEQTFYVSFTLQDLGGFGIPRTELFRSSPVDSGI